MKRSQRVVTLIGLLSISMFAMTSSVSSASSESSKVRWGTAMGVRGLPTHNYLFGSDLFSVSCASAGNCSAGGNYALNAKLSQAFVVNETRGIWGTALPVPGFTRHDASENTEVYVMSCPSAGNCSAGGSYAVSNEVTLVFVMDEKHGTWGRAIEVPGTAQFGSSGGGFITAISCPSAGNCSVGGDLPVAGSTTISGAFVANESHGVWGRAQELSGAPSFNHNGAGVQSLSCASVGDCSVVGDFPKGLKSAGSPSFVATETNGVWGKAREILGSKLLNVADAEVRAVSCGATGNCSAVGQYQQKSGVSRAFIVSESKGVWGRAFNVPGLITLNGRHMSALTTIACAAKGVCSAGGYYGNGSHQIAFIANEAGGIWSKRMLIPGLKALNKGDATYVQTISCFSKGNCGASGTYSDSVGDAESFLVNEVDGMWGPARAVQGLQKLKSNSSGVLSISCGSRVNCSAVGGFSALDNNGAMIVSTELQP